MEDNNKELFPKLSRNNDEDEQADKTYKVASFVVEYNRCI